MTGHPAATTYPAAGDYYRAVQAPARSFTVPKLQAAEFVWDSLGPTLARGSSAVVFQASVQGRPQALRCYIRNDASSRDRYSALDAYLAGHDLRPYVSGTTWLDGAIMVNRAAWPVLTMEWIDGRTLNEYVDFLAAGSNTAALATLAGKWRELVALLQRSDFAHGDLQHGNIMVDQDGQLRLVDFNGVWIPQLAGQAPPTEFGHPNYQHPAVRLWDRWLDTFSALVIYLSLVALGKDPGLWLALYNSKNLLFAKNDFFPPFKTEAWKQLAALGDPQVDELTRRLQECCDPDWVSGRSLEMTLDRQAAPPVRSQIPAEQRWWEKAPTSGTGSAPASSSSRPWSQAAPSAAAAFPAAAPPAASSASAAAARHTASRRSAFWGIAGRRAACSASAVRAARHGGHRTDAAAAADDGAARRHHLVVRAAVSSAPGPARAWIPRVRAASAAHAPRVRAARTGAARPRPAQAGISRAGVVPPPGPGHETAAGAGRGRDHARSRDRAPDHRRGQSHSRRRDRRSRRGRLGHLAARHRDREQRETTRPDLKPPYGTTQFSCFQYASRSPSFVPTMTTMTFCWLSLLTMMGWLLVLVYSAMLPNTVGVVLVKSDSHSVRKSVKLLLVVQSRLLLNFSVLRKLLNPVAVAAGLGNR